MKIVTFYGDNLVIKSDNSILEAFDSFYCQDTNLEVGWGIAVKICHICKSVPVRLAEKFYEDVCFAVDFRKKDLQQGAFAYAFDYSFAVGKWIKRKEADFDGLIFANNTEKLDFVYNQGLLDKVNEAIAKITTSISLKVGDVVFVPFENSLQEVKVGDNYTVVKDDEYYLDCLVK